MHRMQKLSNHCLRLLSSQIQLTNRRVLHISAVFSNHNVEMKNLPIDVSQADIIEFFKPSLPLNVVIGVNHMKLPNGTAMVTFGDQTSVLDALRNNMKKLRNNFVGLEIAGGSGGDVAPKEKITQSFVSSPSSNKSFSSSPPSERLAPTPNPFSRDVSRLYSRPSRGVSSRQQPLMDTRTLKESGVTGSLLWFSKRLQYGFVHRDGEKDGIIHLNEIKQIDPAASVDPSSPPPLPLRSGQEYKFDLYVDDQGLVSARNFTGLNGEAIIVISTDYQTNMSSVSSSRDVVDVGILKAKDMLGSVLWFSERLQYGFVRTTDGQDALIHRRNIKQDMVVKGMEELSGTQPVIFTHAAQFKFDLYENREGKLYAMNMSGLNNEPVTIRTLHSYFQSAPPSNSFPSTVGAPRDSHPTHRQGESQYPSFAGRGVAAAGISSVSASPQSPPVVPSGVERGVSGTLKWFSPRLHYGYVERTDGGPDIFVHMDRIVTTGPGDDPNRPRVVMVPGEKYLFDVIPDMRGCKAIRMTGANGEPIDIRQSFSEPFSRSLSSGLPIVRGAVGTIKWFNPQRGLGFLRRPDDPEGNDVILFTPDVVQSLPPTAIGQSGLASSSLELTPSRMMPKKHFKFDLVKMKTGILRAVKMTGLNNEPVEIANVPVEMSLEIIERDVKGHVKFFDNWRGFGYITRDTFVGTGMQEENTFVRTNYLAGMNDHETSTVVIVPDGAPVLYDLSRNHRGQFVAFNVRKDDGSRFTDDIPDRTKIPAEDKDIHGTVSLYNPRKGFGFIDRAGSNERLIFSRQDLGELVGQSHYKILLPGVPVIFDRVPNNKPGRDNFVAINITRTDGQPMDTGRVVLHTNRTGGRPARKFVDYVQAWCSLKNTFYRNAVRLSEVSTQSQLSKSGFFVSVNNISPGTTEQQVTEFLSPLLPVEIRIGKTTGFDGVERDIAFVDLHSEKDVEFAVLKTNLFLDGRQILVRRHYYCSDASRSMKIHGVPRETTMSHIYSLFSPLSPSAVTPMYPSNGAAYPIISYFVEFDNEVDRNDALELPLEINGREIGKRIMGRSFTASSPDTSSPRLSLTSSPQSF